MVLLDFLEELDTEEVTCPACIDFSEDVDDVFFDIEVGCGNIDGLKLLQKRLIGTLAVSRGDINHDGKDAVDDVL